MPRGCVKAGFVPPRNCSQDEFSRARRDLLAAVFNAVQPWLANAQCVCACLINMDINTNNFPAK